MNRIDLYQTPEHNCPYLSDKQAITQFIDPDLTPDIKMYSYLSRSGFRRSGEHIYRPSCPSCDACIAIRLPVMEMCFSKNQKRCIKGGQQLEYNHCDSFDSDEHYLLYEKYINVRHKGGDMYPPTRTLFRGFLLSNWANTQFMEMRYNQALIACAVYDPLVDGLSAIYCYFDPDYSHLSPGKLAILKQIQFARDRQLEYVYLGYQIDECRKMNYKSKYRPVEQFINATWQRIE